MVGDGDYGARNGLRFFRSLGRGGDLRCWLRRQFSLHDVLHGLHRFRFHGAHVVLDVLYVQPVQQVDESPTVQFHFLG